MLVFNFEDLYVISLDPYGSLVVYPKIAVPSSLKYSTSSSGGEVVMLIQQGGREIDFFKNIWAYVD